jgi:TolB-like protein/DNA-binding winged helix-turn-helix (wHTH) protein/tetratricopeptide (TPR) repeat protein
MESVVKALVYRFGDFELDLGAHQLRLRGEPVRLERRPFELLVLLVTRQGLLVSREEIIERLWPRNVVIEFDTGLNTLIRKVRQALGDSSVTPAYVETVAGVGYRFIAPVSQADTTAGAALPEPDEAVNVRRVIRRDRHATLVIGALLAAVAVAIGFWGTAGRTPGQVSIAVLPFENLSRDEELNYLAAGLAEDTSASLAQADPQRLRLMGRASMIAMAGSGKPTAQVGRELGVDYVVTSSLRAEGPRIRVTSQLVRSADGVVVWTASFDRELTGVLGLQRELSIVIAEQVRLRLSPEVKETVARRQTSNPEAYDLYLRGRYEWSQISPAGLRQALDYFERAIAIDPNYALAWGGIAHVLSTAPIIGDVEPATVAQRAAVAVQRALESGADLAEVQVALGYYHFFLDWDWAASEAAFRRAAALDPNSAIAHLMLGHVRSQSGDHAEARTLARRARELDPFFSHIFALSATIAFQAEDFAAAEELGRQAVAINPQAWVGHLNLGKAQSALGKHSAALASFDKAMRYSNRNFKSLTYRGHALARMGERQKARAVITALEATARGALRAPLRHRARTCRAGRSTRPRSNGWSAPMWRATFTWSSSRWIRAGMRCGRTRASRTCWSAASSSARSRLAISPIERVAYRSRGDGSMCRCRSRH